MISTPQDAMQLSEETLRWRDRAREFANEHIRPAAEREWIPDPEERMAWDVVEAGSRAGFRTVAVPPEYGGPDPALSPLAMAMIVEEFAAAEPGIAIMFNHAIKDARQVARLGTEEQKKRFFSEFVADDRYLTATGLTEPDHGADRWMRPEGFRFETTAVRAGDEWVLNGRKHCIADGNEARLILVHATTDPTQRYEDGTTMFMVHREDPGVRKGEVHNKTGLRMLNNSEVILEDCRIPLDRVLGEVNRGVTQVGDLLNDNDLLSLAMKLGIARAAYDTALDHAKNRVQGGKPIIEHQAVGLKLTEMAALVESIRAHMYRYASMIANPGTFDPMVSELATWHAVESAFRAATLGVQVCGCYGSWLDHPAQKHLRDAMMYFPNDGTHTIHLLTAHRMMLAAR